MIEVRLGAADVERYLEAGKRRHADRRATGSTPRYPGCTVIDDQCGAGTELAAATAYGIPWAGEHRRRPDAAGEPDLEPDLEIRGVDWIRTDTRPHLRVYPADPAERRFVLVERRSGLDRFVVAGWLPGVEARSPGFWQESAPFAGRFADTWRPCYWIPAAALRPAETLEIGDRMAAHVKRRNHGSGHSYWDIGANGDEIKLDGVTTLLRDGIPKGGLSAWAAKQAAGYAVDHWAELSELGLLERGTEIQYAWQRERDRLAARGTAIHALADNLSHGRAVEVPDELAGHVDSCLAFLNTHGFRPLVTESVVVNRTGGYAGTLDAVGTMHGHRYILDWKTGGNIYAEHALQLAAYAHAEHYVNMVGDEQPIADLQIERGAVVHLRSDGFDVYPMRIDEPVYAVFRHVAYLARWVRWDKDSGTSALDVFKGPAMAAPSLRSVS